MGAVDRPEARLTAIEDRHKSGQIGQVIAAVIGVVEQKDIALVNVIAKKLGYRPGRIG